jgi:hypothetical protein
MRPHIPVMAGVFHGSEYNLRQRNLQHRTPSIFTGIFMRISEAFRARRPDCATIVGFVFGPDVVMAYLGRGLMAIAYFVGGVSVSAALVWVFVRFSIPSAYGALVVLAWHSYGAMLGYRVARSLPSGTMFPWYARWYNIVLLFSAAIIPLAIVARGFIF